MVLAPKVTLAAEPTSSMDTTADAARVLPQLATVTTDTGDFAPGPRSFTHYTNPLWCLEAARHTRDVQRTSLAAQASLDTLQRTPERDTLPVAVATVARACGAQFTVMGTVAPELPDLFQLALLEGNEPLAHAVLARRLALTTTDSARWALFLWGIDAYLHAEPARVVAAESLMAQLDAQGPIARLARLGGHEQLLAFGEATFDPGRMRQEAAHIITLAQTLTVPELQAQPEAGAEWQPRGGWLLRHAFETLMTLDYVSAPDSMPALAQRIQATYRSSVLSRYLADAEHHDPYNNDGGRKYSKFSTANGQTRVTLASPSTLPINDIISQSLPFSRSDFQQLSSIAPPVQAVYWFPDGAAGDTVQPARGRVSLILNTFPWGCLYSQQSVINGQCNGDEDELVIGRLRRWLRQYGAAGLTITVVTGIAAAGKSILEQAPVSPATVAQTLNRYLREELHLPVTLAVDTVSLALRVAAPDGRTFDGPTALTKQWEPNFTGSLYYPNRDIVVLTDREGRILYKGDRLADPMLDALVAHAMATHASTATLSSTEAPASTPVAHLSTRHSDHP